MKPITQWTTEDILEILKGVDRKTWIKIGAGTAVGAVLLIFIVIPAWFKRPAVRQQIATAQMQIVSLRTAIRKRPEWIKNREEFQKFIQGSKDRIYQPGESSLLLGAISKLAVESKVGIIASKPKDFEGKLPPPFDQSYEANLYDFVVEGGYHELGEFISKIEANPKLLRVQLFSIRAQEENAEKHIADVSLSAVSFKERKP